jgi:predicted RNase H-like HicB family nuclease
MEFQIEVEQENDGRWIAEVMDIPGVMVYGEDKAHAIAKVKALAFRVMADWVELALEAKSSEAHPVWKER